MNSAERLGQCRREPEPAERSSGNRCRRLRCCCRHAACAAARCCCCCCRRPRRGLAGQQGAHGRQHGARSTGGLCLFSSAGIRGAQQFRRSASLLLPRAPPEQPHSAASRAARRKRETQSRPSILSLARLRVSRRRTRGRKRRSTDEAVLLPSARPPWGFPVIDDQPLRVLEERSWEQQCVCFAERLSGERRALVLAALDRELVSRQTRAAATKPPPFLSLHNLTPTNQTATTAPTPSASAPTHKNASTC